MFGNKLDRAWDHPVRYHEAYLHGLTGTVIQTYGQDDVTSPTLTGSTDVSGSVILFFDVDVQRDENSYAVSYGTNGNNGT